MGGWPRPACTGCGLPLGCLGGPVFLMGDVRADGRLFGFAGSTRGAVVSVADNVSEENSSR
jgi:hypothetical protein